MTYRSVFALVAAISLAALGCEDADDASEGGGTDTDPYNDCSPDGATECVDGDFMVCQGGDWTLSEECAGDTPVCHPSLGCVMCEPGESFCEGNAVYSCAEDGAGSTLVEECDDIETCVAGECSSSCADAEQAKSYTGCHFIAVSTSNAILDTCFDSDFAVIVGNPSSTIPADVTVSRAGGVVATATVQPGSTAAISLPMVMEIKGAQETVLATGAAYEVESNSPVVAYQYSPLHFEMSGTNSYTNDASILLPEHTLTGEYMASTWPTWGHGNWMKVMGTLQGDWSAWYPGFVAVAATADGTQVTITSSTNTQGGDIPALAPGETATATLDRGDVLQVYSRRADSSAEIDYCEQQGWQQTNDGVCPPVNMIQECDAFCSVTDGDLTGTRVSATEPVAVFAGHMCTFMPYYEWACDHLEEMMFPLDAWGESAVMTAPMSPDGDVPVPTLYRVLARDDGTHVSFSPEVRAPIVLAAGQFVEFESGIDFVVEADKQIFVTQTMLGENALDTSSGDPAMGSGIPIFQNRGVYNFLVPDTYTANYLNVVAPTGTTVNIDDAPISGWEWIGLTEYSVARVPLDPGPHRAKSLGDVGFGITAYGYASYTSYFYPGGMNVSAFIE